MVLATVLWALKESRNRRRSWGQGTDWVGSLVPKEGIVYSKALSFCRKRQREREAAQVPVEATGIGPSVTGSCECWEPNLGHAQEQYSY